MATKVEVIDMMLRKSEDLCKMVEEIGYRRSMYGQLQNNNGSFCSSLLDFFDDNPGAMDAVREWALENLEDDFDEEGEEEDEEESEDGNFSPDSRS